MITGYIKSRDKQNASLSLSHDGQISITLKKFDQYTGEEIEGQTQKLEMQHFVMEKEHIEREIEERTKQLDEINAVLEDVQTKYGL